MPELKSIKRTVCRWFTSIPFFIVLGLGLGVLISVPMIPRPNIAIVTISGPIVDQAYADSILDILRTARDTRSIKAVVLRVDSPGGGASSTEQIYLDTLRLRQYKPVVSSIGTIAASGGYYAAVASNYIYAEPTSQIGSIGAWVSLPEPEQVEEGIGTSGPFKATGGSRQKVLGHLEMVRQGFINAVKQQRGERLKLSDEELSRAEIHIGIESLRYGLIDEIGTKSTAIEKAASLAGIRNYGVVELTAPQPAWLWLFSSSDMAALKSQPTTIPLYYYLYFESR